MHFHQLFHQCQAQAQAPVRPLRRRVNLCEELENGLELVRSEPYTVVFYAQQKLVPRLFERDPHMAVLLREPDSVGKEVGYHLRQPGNIAVQIQWCIGQCQCQMPVSGFIQCGSCLHGICHQLAKFHLLAPQFYFSTADTAHIEQIVYQPHQVIHLPVHHRHRRAHALVIPRSHFHDLQRVAHGCKRVTELVGEHGQKLVLPPVGLPQGFLGRLGAGNVNKCEYDAVNAVFGSAVR